MTRVNRKFSPDTESLTQVLATGMPTQLLVIKTRLSAVSRLGLFIDPSCQHARDCAQHFLNACHISSTQQPLAFIPQLQIQQPPFFRFRLLETEILTSSFTNQDRLSSISERQSCSSSQVFLTLKTQTLSAILFSSWYTLIKFTMPSKKFFLLFLPIKTIEKTNERKQQQ